MGEPASEANLSGQMGGWVGSGYIKPEFISCTNEDTKQIVEQPSLEFIRKIWTENINLGTINREIYQKYEKEIKRRLLLGRKIMTNLDSILKVQRHYFVNKGLFSQGYGFSSGHVWMYVRVGL